MILSQKNYNILLNSNILFGVLSVKENLTKIIQEKKRSKVFLATDNGLVQSGIIDQITELFEQDGIEYVVFSDVEPNPHMDTVMRGAEVYKGEGCDLIVAVGGGSSMDFAKAVGVMTRILPFSITAGRPRTVTNEIPL